MFMLQFLKYAQRTWVFAELPTSTIVSDTSVPEETLFVWLQLPDAAFASLRIFHKPIYFCSEWIPVPRFEPD